MNCVTKVVEFINSMGWPETGICYEVPNRPQGTIRSETGRFEGSILPRKDDWMIMMRDRNSHGGTEDGSVVFKSVQRGFFEEYHHPDDVEAEISNKRVFLPQEYTDDEMAIAIGMEFMEFCQGRWKR